MVSGSANLMIARQENVQGSRSHFPILVKLFALWWQMLVQTSDITVRSLIAKACAHCRRPDCDCLFRSYAVDIYALRSFSCLFNLLLADTDTAPFNFSRTTAADPGLMLQTPSPLLLSNKPFRLAKTNVCDRFKRTFTECSARFGSACYLLRQPLLLTSSAKFNRRSVRLFFFKEGYKFQYVIATACKKAKKPGLLRANFPIFFVIRQSLRSLKNK